ncbi:Hpt domain-containing protein [Nisaea acidiphila]|uniref:Hpt domain-containing protein n=1 Tax=Nisaea acidiphila TaxID=1862145 RepID=A0A9J7ASS5_9PROT|nr:Hpt domain-containing protein [Nisaea acidiphila]UUX50335.1 Hpt domain-containing protein [Nisaea acidiphila]
MSETSMKEAFLRLREEFLQICRGRVDAIREQERVLRSGASATDKSSALETIRRETHTISGSSGTYGYADLSNSARSVELACGSHLAEPDGQPDDILERLAKLYADADKMFADPDIGTIPF